MKGFLNNCADYFKKKEEAKDTSEEVQVLSLLEKTLTSARGALGERPFHLRGRLNYSVLDATIVALMTKGVTALTKLKYDKLLTNEDFLRSASYDTSDGSVLKKRFELAMDAFGKK
jgi:hypothetical protein